MSVAHLMYIGSVKNIGQLWL